MCAHHLGFHHANEVAQCNGLGQQPVDVHQHTLCRQDPGACDEQGQGVIGRVGFATRVFDEMRGGIVS